MRKVLSLIPDPKTGGRAILSITVMFVSVVCAYVALYALEPTHADRTVVILVGLLAPTIASLQVISGQSRLRERVDRTTEQVDYVGTRLDHELDDRIRHAVRTVLSEPHASQVDHE